MEKGQNTNNTLGLSISKSGDTKWGLNDGVSSMRGECAGNQCQYQSFGVCATLRI